MIVFNTRVAKAAILGTVALALTSGVSLAQSLTMWARSSSAEAAQGMVDLWNESHDAQIELTVIPDNQMVTRLATGVQAGDVADLVSFDLIFMPDFMRAGVLTDLTDILADDPNHALVAEAYRTLSTYEGRIYGTGFTPDVSVLLYNKDLFEAAGLDPEQPPETIAELQDYATKIAALGDDTYGYYFSGSCPGCNIFTMAPMMWGSGAKILPAGPDETALEGPGISEVLTMFHEMWTNDVIPDSAEGDAGENFTAVFQTGKLGMQGAGGYTLSTLKRDFPDLNFGVAFLPGIEPGDVSSFVGGDVIAIPQGAANPDIAAEFIQWQLTDEAQMQGLAANFLLPSRTDLADNEYFREDPRYVTTAEALAIGQTPYAFNFNQMVNSDSSPWIQMLQVAIFDGDIEGAITTARDALERIAGR